MMATHLRVAIKELSMVPALNAWSIASVHPHLLINDAMLLRFCSILVLSLISLCVCR